jgi:hypothetical protein
MLTHELWNVAGKVGVSPAEKPLSRMLNSTTNDHDGVRHRLPTLNQ